MKKFRIIVGLAATAAAVTAGAMVPAMAGNVTDSDAEKAAAYPSKAGVPDSYSVTHKAWQQKGKASVPAAMQLSLRTFGVKVTQETLTKQTDSKDGQTDWRNSQIVYGHYVNKLGYFNKPKGDLTGAKLMNYVSHDVGVLHRAVPMGINLSKASWIEGGSNTMHAITVRGYDKEKGTVTIWDPAQKSRSFAGHHVVSAKALAKASEGNGIFYVTKS